MDTPPDQSPTERPPGKPLARTVAILMVALGASLAGAIAARAWLGRPMTAAAAVPATQVAAVYAEPRPLPAFMLVAHDGTPFDVARLRGRWSVLFFGFTNCADVCPTTLAELASVHRRLRDLPAAQLPSVVMVSVDPKRDTPEKLARYVPYFDPAFLGVTGAPEALDRLTRALGVAVRIGPEVDGAYTVDHTAALFLVDPQARVVAVFPAPHAAETIAADYRTIVAAAREPRG